MGLSLDLATRKGDMLEVKLMNRNFEPYFKARFDLSNKKQIKLLRDTLRDKGIEL